MQQKHTLTLFRNQRFMLYEITWSKTLQNSPFFNLVVFCFSSLGIPWTNCEAFYQIISSIINIKFLQSVAGNRCFVRNISRLRNHSFLFHFSHFFFKLLLCDINKHHFWTITMGFIPIVSHLYDIKWYPNALFCTDKC